MQILQLNNIAEVELKKYMLELTTTTYWTRSSLRMYFIHSYTENHPTLEQSRKTKDQNKNSKRRVNRGAAAPPGLSQKWLEAISLSVE